MSTSIHPVDEVLPAPRMVALGLQHVLVMYANAVAVPLILGGALHLPKDQLALLINADLFACGIATLVQTIGFGPFGIRLPVIMGVTAVAIPQCLPWRPCRGLVSPVFMARSSLADCSASWWPRSCSMLCASSRRS
jgi:xanthine/uracil permease